MAHQFSQHPQHADGVAQLERGVFNALRLAQVLEGEGHAIWTAPAERGGWLVGLRLAGCDEYVRICACGHVVCALTDYDGAIAADCGLCTASAAAKDVAHLFTRTLETFSVLHAPSVAPTRSSTPVNRVASHVDR